MKSLFYLYTYRFFHFVGFYLIRSRRIVFASVYLKLSAQSHLFPRLSFFQEYGLGDCLHDIAFFCNYLSPNKSILYFVSKRNFGALSPLVSLFPNIQLCVFPPSNFYSVSLWRNSSRCVDRSKSVLRSSDLIPFQKVIMPLYSVVLKSLHLSPHALTFASLIPGISLHNIVKSLNPGIDDTRTEIIICNSAPMSGQANLTDLAIINSLGLCLSKRYRVLFTSDMSGTIDQSVVLRHNLSDLLSINFSALKIVLGIPNAPFWCLIRNNVNSFVVCRDEDLNIDDINLFSKPSAAELILSYFPSYRWILESFPS